MAQIVEPPLPEPRYTYGGDEFIFCEIDEAMSFHANFKALAICQELGRRNVEGVVEICPANASYLVRLDPDVIRPDALMAQLKEIDASVDTEHLTLRDARDRRARVLRRPVDARGADALPRPAPEPDRHRPRVRHAHQRVHERAGVHRRSPRRAVLRLDGRLRSGPSLVLSRWCRASECSRCRSTCARAPTRRRSRSRTAAPSRPSTRCSGPGGYQLFAICPVPIFDPKEELPDFQDSFVIFRAGRHPQDPVDRPRGATTRSAPRSRRRRTATAWSTSASNPTSSSTIRTATTPSS